jgi:hypothetical protein
MAFASKSQTTAKSVEIAMTTGSPRAILR